MTGFNYHTHSNFSDGGKPAEKYVQEAIRQGMSDLGFSDHAPMPFKNTFSIQSGNYEYYCSEINRLKNVYADKLNIFLGLEIDFIPGMMEDFAGLIQQGNLDYSIGSVHLVGNGNEKNLWFTDGPKIESYDYGLQTFFGGDIRKAVKAFYNQTNQMIVSQLFDVIGHFDKVKMHNQNRYFTEDEKWYAGLVFETLELIKQRGIIVEVNTRGIYKKRSDSFFPSDFILRRMKELEIPLIISSDAHHPEELQFLFDKAVKAVQEAGYNRIMRFTNEGWVETNLMDN
jgi:histidinol-phosphatase (PHP family)